MAKALKLTRYFFHVHHGPFAHIDAVGEKLLDRRAASNEATKYAGEVIREIDGRLRPDADWHLDVTDQKGRSVYRIVVSAKLAK
jgi:hypothetical protein